jgi:hypothetical protein
MPEESITAELTRREQDRLPKWALSVILNLRAEVAKHKDEIRRLKQVHAIMDGKSWFTVGGPPPSAVRGEVVNLWWLDNDGAHAACSLRVGDVFLVGRREVTSNA